MSSPLIDVAHLTKQYGRTTVLDIRSWWADAGTNAVLRGENGAGKSTLLLLLAGLVRPTSGQATVAGQPLGSRGARRALSFVPDEPALFDDLTLAEQMAYVARLNGLDRAPKITEDLFDRFDADQLRDRFPRSMSKGQRQKAGLLLAFSRPFQVLLLDEPTTGLDASSAAALIEVLTRVADDGQAVVSSTHDPDLIASATAVTVISKGRRVEGWSEAEVAGMEAADRSFDRPGEDDPVEDDPLDDDGDVGSGWAVAAGPVDPATLKPGFRPDRWKRR
ncbi:MAG: ATP-binding cassette domain-containing protein [Acidimicrobiales bacterium]